MLISTKGRYALRVMIDLAEHQSDEFISLKGIAQRQEISEKYLESIIRMLVKAKVVDSLRGKGDFVFLERGLALVVNEYHIPQAISRKALMRSASGAFPCTAANLRQRSAAPAAPCM